MKPIFTSYAKTAELAAQDFADVYFARPRNIEKFEGDMFVLQDGVRTYHVTLNVVKNRAFPIGRWMISVADEGN